MAVEDIERLINQLESSPDEEYRQKIIEAVEPILQFHREACLRILQILREQGQGHLLALFLQDPVLESLFQGYGLIPDAPPPQAGVKEDHPPAPRPDKLITIQDLLARTQKKWLPLVHEFELQEGGFIKIKLFEEEILVWATQGRVFACKDLCPRSGGSLAPATLEDLAIVCPCHGYHYELGDGRCREIPGLKLEVLPVALEDGVLKVGI